MAEMINAHETLVGKFERSRMYGKHTRRLEGNIKLDSQEMGCKDVAWIYVTHDNVQWRALLNTVMTP
jgi:hypothetical protein